MAPAARIAAFRRRCVHAAAKRSEQPGRIIPSAMNVPSVPSESAVRPVALGRYAVGVGLLVVAGVWFQLDARQPSELWAQAEALYLTGHAGGPVRAVEAFSDTLWLGEGIGLTQLSIADPGFPELVARHVVGPESEVLDLFAAPGSLYVAASDGLRRYGTGQGDFGETAFVRTPGRAVGVAAAASQLLVADETYGLLIVDATDGLSVEAAVPMDGGATAPPAVTESLAAVAGGEVLILKVGAGGVHPVARVDVEGITLGVALAGNYLYISSTGGGLTALDLSVPEAPVVTSEQPMTAGRLLAFGGHLYLGGAGARVLDLSDPGHPRDVHGVPGPFEPFSGAADLSVQGETLYGALGVGMRAMSLADPVLPTASVEWRGFWPVVDIAIDGSETHVLIAKGAFGLDIVDISDATRAVAIMSYVPPGGVYGVAIDGSDAYLSTTRGGERLDLRDPSDPIPTGALADDWPVSPWIDASGGTVVGLGTDTLVTWRAGVGGHLDFDVLPDWPVGGTARGVAVVGTMAYLALGSAGLVAIDVGDPEEPRYLGSMPLEGDVHAIDVDSDAIVVGLDDGYAVLSHVPDRLPRLEARMKIGTAVHDVAVVSGHALLVTHEGTVQMIELQAPNEPGPVVYRSGAPLQHIVAQRGGAIVAGSRGLLILEDEASEIPVPTAVASGTAPTEPPPPRTREPSATPTATAESTSTPDSPRYRLFAPIVSS
jgi:hypothetical protein